MRPRWGALSFHTRVPGGALLRTPWTESWLAGRNAHALLQALAPRLDGTSTLDEVCGGLEPAQAEAVSALVHELAGLRAIVDVDADEDPTAYDLPAGMDDWLEAATHAPRRAARRLAAARVAVLEGQAGTPRLVSHLYELQVGTVESWPAPLSGMGSDLWAGRLRGCDLVIHLGGNYAEPIAIEADLACRRMGVPLLHGGRLGARFALGPVSGQAGCLSCARTALQPAEAEPGIPLSPGLARLAGTLLGSAATLRAYALLCDPALGPGPRTVQLVRPSPPDVETHALPEGTGCERCATRPR